MISDQYISVREAGQTLGVSEKKIMDLIDEDRLQAYRIAGQFLRLKKTDVVSLRSAGEVQSETAQHPYTFSDKVKDFLYFSDFYIISFGIVAFLLYAIFKLE